MPDNADRPASFRPASPLALSRWPHLKIDLSSLSVSNRNREALAEIIERLSRLQREAEAAGLYILGLLLEKARREAEKRLAESGKPPPPANGH